MSETGLQEACPSVEIEAPGGPRPTAVLDLVGRRRPATEEGPAPVPGLVPVGPLTGELGGRARGVEEGLGVGTGRTRMRDLDGPPSPPFT